MTASSDSGFQGTKIRIPRAEYLRVADTTGMSEEDYVVWKQFVRTQFANLRVYPEGLGSWNVELSSKKRTDRGYQSFINSISPAAASPFYVELANAPTSRGYKVHKGQSGFYRSASPPEASPSDVELADLPKSENHPIDTDWLGSYSCPNAGIPILRLYVDRIQSCSREQPSCTQWDLAAVVLRHELGHHVSRLTPEEAQAYDSSTKNAETCRPETAAQLFAWLTSDSAGRALIEKLDLKPGSGQATAYNRFWFFVQFAEGSLTASQSKLSPPYVVRPGWTLAWQLTQSPKYAEFKVPGAIRKNVACRASMETQCSALAAQVGVGSVWPIIETLGFELSRLLDGDGEKWHSAGYSLGDDDMPCWQSKLDHLLRLYSLWAQHDIADVSCFFSKTICAFGFMQPRDDLFRFWFITSEQESDALGWEL